MGVKQLDKDMKELEIEKIKNSFIKSIYIGVSLINANKIQKMMLGKSLYYFGFFIKI